MEKRLNKYMVRPCGALVKASMAVLLLLYLGTYLFVQYTTSLAPVTLHSLLLVPGVLVATWAIMRGYEAGACARFSLDWTLFAALALLFLISVTVVNWEAATWLKVRPYLLSLLSFFFVRVAAVQLPTLWLYRLLAFFLVTSGVLVLCQVYLGVDYYVATYLGGRIPVLYGTGLATLTNLAGVMILWALAILISKLAAEPTNSVFWRRAIPIILGTVGLYFTLSRGAILGLGVVLVALLLAHASRGGSLRQARRVAVVVVASLLVAYLLPSKLDGYIATKITGELPPHDDGADAASQWSLGNTWLESGCDQFVPNSNGYSVNTRLLVLQVSAQVLAEHPLWGAGLDRFKDYYQACFVRLPSAVQSRLDPRPRMTTHNAYLEIATDVGGLFTVVVLALVGLALRQAWSDWNGTAFHLSLGLLAVLTWMVTHDFFKDRLFWIALALTLAQLPARQRTTAIGSST